MTEQEMKSQVSILANESDSTLVGAYLNSAKSTVLRRLYPYGIPDGAIVPPQYEMLTCNLAVRYILRRGGEGEITHNENGVNRTYQSVNDEDLLREIVQVAKVV